MYSITIYSQEKETVPLRIYFNKNSSKLNSKEAYYNDSIISQAFTSAECNKILVVVFSKSIEVRKDSLISFKRYKALVDYVKNKKLGKEPIYVYFNYEPEEKNGSSDSIIDDRPFLDIVPLKCSLIKR